jgi:hypothetical protein
MGEEEKNDGPGNVTIEKISIVPLGSNKHFDLSTGSWLGLSIYEDILDSTITGKIAVQDTQNIPQLLNLRGGESIFITFNAPNLNPVKFDGKIIKITEGTPSPPYSRVYMFEFASSELISSTVQNVKKSYRDQYSVMVKKLFEQYLAPRGKKCHIENTLGIHTVNVTGWTPITAIRNLASRALPDNPKYQKPTFLFFERCDDGKGGGGFFFTSLEKLWLNPPARTYNDQPKNLDRTSVDDYFSINWIEEQERPDLITNIKMGNFDRKILMNDLVKGHTTVQRVNAQGGIQNLNNEDPIAGGLMDFPEAEPVVFRAMSEQHHSDGQETYTIPHPAVIKAQRVNAMTRLLSNQVVTIGVPGDSERAIGEIVKLSIMSKESPAHGPPPEDKFLSGKYLVTALAHVIDGNTQEYETVLELSKDSNISA